MNNRNYRINIFESVNSDGTKQWIAEYPDIFGLIGVGDTQLEAMTEAEAAKNIYLDYLEQQKEKFPVKSKRSELSGRLTLRVSKTTHQKIIDRASSDGISLNQLINDSIIYYLSEKSIDENFKRIEENLLEGMALIKYKAQPYREEMITGYKIKQKGMKEYEKHLYEI